MAVLTLEYIKTETGEFDEESVFQAILTKRSISLIDAVNKCCNLRWLDLSQNQIIRMENLDGLAQLMSLDLSHNKIQKVQSLEGMPNLERLKLKSNPISRIQDLEGLRCAKVAAPALPERGQHRLLPGLLEAGVPAHHPGDAARSLCLGQ